MTTFFQRLVVRFKLWRAQRQLRRLLTQQGTFATFEAIPGRLTLESFNPGEPKTGYARGEKVTYFNSTWDGQAYLPLWDGRANVSLSVGGKHPTQQQVDLLQTVFEYDAAVGREVEAALFDYYRNNIFGKIYIEEKGRDVTAARVPELEKPSAIRRLILGVTLCVDDDGAKTGEWSLGFGCTWDEEHNVTVKFQDRRITFVGI